MQTRREQDAFADSKAQRVASDAAKSGHFAASLATRFCGVLTLLSLLFLSSCSRNADVTNPVGSTAATAPTASRSDPNAPGFFADMTANSGVTWRFNNGQETNDYTMLEEVGGGVALIDYDRDGLLDIFVTGGGTFRDHKQIVGHPVALFRNEGNWKFRNVTNEVGLDKIDFFNLGCAVADYDKDGWPDLLVTGYGRMALFRNDKGKFSDVTDAAGLNTPRDIHFSTSAAWGDFNGDGHLDLFVAHYVDWSFQNYSKRPGYQEEYEHGSNSPRSMKPLPQAIYFNNGDGTFRDMSQELGIKPGKALGVLIADLNDDNRLDIYVANDAFDNHLYVNQGAGRFAEMGVPLGVSGSEIGKPDGSMGVDAADYAGTGHFSLFVTNYEHELHALYLNRGSGPFTHMSTRAGLTALGMDLVSWATAFIDYDLNGIEDIFLTSGHTVRQPIPPVTNPQRTVLLQNLRKPGDKPHEVRFRDISHEAGPYFRVPHRGRGAAFGDIDNDGRTDIVLNNVNEGVVLLRNVLKNGNHWLGIGLVGKQHPDAIGAKLTLEVGGQKLVRQVKGGGSYMSANDRRIVFGLGNESRVGKLTVRWPSGATEIWDNLPIDGYWRLVEGIKEPKPGL